MIFNSNQDREPVNDAFKNTIESLFEEEEEILNLHMNIIQENAELLTEEGKLLHDIQGDDVDKYN